MARFAAAVVLSALVSRLSAASEDACDAHAAVGQSLELSFPHEGPPGAHLLKWTHNDTIVFYRQQGRVSVGKPEDVSATGGLLLRSLQHSSAGAYQANWLPSNATGVKTWTTRLCVMNKVPKPRLTYVCDPKSSAVSLLCGAAAAAGPRAPLLFSWTLDDKTLTGETGQTLSVSLARLKGARSFTCSVANKISQERSDVVRPTCKSPSPSPPPPPPPMLCFKPRTVMAAAAGGAGLALLSLVLSVALCCCHRRNGTKMRLRDEKQELRVLSPDEREAESPVSPVYETMHPTEGSAPPSPRPSPRAARQGEPLRAAAPTGNGPVPKPRTKSPQTSNL